MDAYKKARMKSVNWFDCGFPTTRKNVKKALKKKVKANLKRQARKMIDEALAA